MCANAIVQIRLIGITQTTLYDYSVRRLFRDLAPDTPGALLSHLFRQATGIKLGLQANGSELGIKTDLQKIHYLIK